MVDNKRNSSSGILVLILLIFFFSIAYREKETHTRVNAMPSSIISDTNGSGLQAIIGTATRTPGTDFSRVSPIAAKIAGMDCPAGREFRFNNLLSRCFSSCQLNVLPEQPIIGFVFLQKIPEQGKDDDIPSVS
jgi:hypothetical protein